MYFDFLRSWNELFDWAVPCRELPQYFWHRNRRLTWRARFFCIQIRVLGWRHDQFSQVAFSLVLRNNDWLLLTFLCGTFAISRCQKLVLAENDVVPLTDRLFCRSLLQGRGKVL